MMGLKPTTSRATIWRSNQLNYIHHIICRKFKVARLKGLEPLTHCLEGSCSIQLSYQRISNCLIMIPQEQDIVKHFFTNFFMGVCYSNI